MLDPDGHGPRSEGAGHDPPGDAEPWIRVAHAQQRHTLCAVYPQPGILGSPGSEPDTEDPLGPCEGTPDAFGTGAGTSDTVSADTRTSGPFRSGSLGAKGSIARSCEHGTQKSLRRRSHRDTGRPLEHPAPAGVCRSSEACVRLRRRRPRGIRPSSS